MSTYYLEGNIWEANKDRLRKIFGPDKEGAHIDSVVSAGPRKPKGTRMIVVSGKPSGGQITAMKELGL